MILFNLQCQKGHLFEAWFRDNAGYDAQVAAGTVDCPHCGSHKVSKAVMSPRIAKQGTAEQAAAPQMAEPSQPDLPAEAPASQQELRAALTKLRDHVEANCDYVGGAFPEEARKIHYGETEARGIYGEASETEAKDLAEEGVDFAVLPLPRRKQS